MIRLSKRLAAIAKHVPEGACVIDVGTDHGHLPVWLIQSGRACRVIASDINAGPLSRAAVLVEETDTGEQIHLQVCDGLSAFTKADGDCVVIAGMGGETMVHILSAAPWTAENVRLVLQPQSKGELLRSWLLKNGYVIEKEELVEDAGRLYSVLAAHGGSAVGAYSAAELLCGRWAQIEGDPLLPAYISEQVKKRQKAAPHDPEAAALLEELKEWKARL